MVSDVFVTIIIGILSGLVGGALGQSGSGFMLPALLVSGVVPSFKTAAGTTLLAIIPPLSIFAVIQYYKRGQVQVKTSLILMATYICVAYLGAYFTKDVTNTQLQYISGFYFLMLSAFFFWNGYTGTYGSKDGFRSH